MRRFLLLVLFAACAVPVHAQLQVTLEIKRRFLMRYEPIVATVTVRNQAGRDVVLSDLNGLSWFGFQVTRNQNQIVPPHDLNYSLDPVKIPIGKSIRRSITLNNAYAMGETGTYRVRAVIYDANSDKHFESAPIVLELSEGKSVWFQDVGVPEGVKGAGDLRRVSLLTFRQAERTFLYARVADMENSVIHTTVALGPYIAGVEPDVQLDIHNTLHVFQVVAPKQYRYSRISVNGEFLGQDQYTTQKYRPVLRRDASGEIYVYGGHRVEKEDSEVKPNKLSDRPVPLPAD